MAAHAAPRAATRETVRFRLYKFQQPVGREEATIVRHGDGSVDVRTNFSFRDRGSTVPLAATLSLGRDGAPVRFQVWGATSRSSSVDDLVTVSHNTVTIEETGTERTAARPAAFFVASAYAPAIVTELLFRHWTAIGRPASLQVFPAGPVHFERRGAETITHDDGTPRTLERYALTGLGWGRETIWVDAEGRLAALKGVDAEFDHFEATRTGYSEALETFVASAAADGMAALREVSASLLTGSDETRATAFVGGTLIDATGAPPVPDAVVVVEDGRIRAAGPRAAVSIPDGARRVDVTGRYLLPGLWDMHAHVEQVEWGPLYLAAGVTTVRDCGNETAFIRAVRDTVQAGRGLGPRILLACFVDGDGPSSIGLSRLRDAEGIPALIAKFRESGCSQVKIYSSLDPKLIAPLARAAHDAGLSVTGHVPDGIGAVHAVEAGMDQINHLDYVVRALLPATYDPDVRLTAPILLRAFSEIDLASETAKKTIAFFAERRVVVDPTLALTELGTHTREEIVAVEPGLAKLAAPLRAPFASLGVPPDEVADAHRVWEVSLATLRALHAAGVPIVAGTDQAVPGHSLHRELELYVAAGFTPLEAIQAATIVPARAMKREQDLGTIEAGKIADFIVVEGDPLRDIRALRHIVTVVAGGRAWDPAGLWKSVGFAP